MITTIRRKTHIQTAQALTEMINPNSWISVHLCNPWGRRDWTFSVTVEREGEPFYQILYPKYFGTFRQASAELVRYLRFVVVSPTTKVIAIRMEHSFNK